MALLETWTSSLGLLSLSLLLGSSGISFRPLLTRVEMLLSSQATIALVGLKLHVEADSRTTSGGYITHTQSPIISCEKIRWEVEILIHTFATDHKEFTICELSPPLHPPPLPPVYTVLASCGCYYLLQQDNLPLSLKHQLPSYNTVELPSLKQLFLADSYFYQVFQGCCSQ